MTITSDEKQSESMLVMLVRMEGKLDLTSQRLGDVVPRVERHEQAITDLLLSVQGLADAADSRDRANAAAWKARDDTVEATARALAEAKSTQDDTAKQEVLKSNMSWNPWTKVFAVAAFIGVLVSIWVSVGA